MTTAQWESVWVCVYGCVCVLGRERSWVFASTALAVAWMSMYQTGSSDYLIAFHEPLLPLYRCHWFEKCSVHWLINHVRLTCKSIVTGCVCIYVWTHSAWKTASALNWLGFLGTISDWVMQISVKLCMIIYKFFALHNSWNAPLRSISKWLYAAID